VAENVTTITKLNQTVRNKAEPLRVDSIFGSGVRRSRIGVALAELCVAVVLTGGEVYHEDSV
jgi:hypothetical protein